MDEKVKQEGRSAGRRRGTTRVSRKNQITIPVAALRTARLSPGDAVSVEATGVGQVVLTRVDALVDRYAGALDTGGRLRGQVEKLREEWR